MTMKDPYLTSVSPAIETRRNPHCIIILYVKMFWIESCLGNILFDTFLCVIMQGIIYLHLKDYSEVGQTSIFHSFCLEFTFE